MHLKSLLSGSLLICAFSVSAANLGTLDLSSGSTGFSATPAAGVFSDFFTFTLPSASTANSSVTAVVNGTQDVDFSSIVIAGASGSFAFTQLLGDPVEVWALPAAGVQLAAGTYTLTFNGTNSASIGSFGGNLAVTVVPEPGTHALLLAGVGVLGFLMRRRRPD